MIVWDKMSMGLGHHYRLQHELIIYATKGSPKKTNRKDVPNIIRCKRVRRDRHPTEKPIELLKTFITMSTDPGDVVLDFFAGSGTTLVAAKELGRRYIGIELNRAYCQLAQDRLAGITGELVEVTR